MSNIEVVGLGALNIDYLYRVERILEDGETVVNEAKLSPGGSAANTIYGLAKLGVNTGFIGVVGDDAEGRILLEDFRKAGVDTSQIGVKPGAKTGSALCLSDKLGFRSIYIAPGANSLLTVDDLDLNYINQAKMLHVSSFVNDTQFKALLELMDKLDLSVKLSFAPGSLYSARGLEALTPILSRTYILFTNENEMRQLTGKDFNNGAKTCLKQGCHIVVVTFGKGKTLALSQGRRSVSAVCYIREADNEYVVKSNSIVSRPKVDTTGAGDAFAAGFLYGLLKGKRLEQCGRLGDIVAQFCISEIGAREGLPTLCQLAQRYQECYGKEL